MKKKTFWEETVQIAFLQYTFFFTTEAADRQIRSYKYKAKKYIYETLLYVPDVSHYQVENSRPRLGGVQELGKKY